MKITIRSAIVGASLAALALLPQAVQASPQSVLLTVTVTNNQAATLTSTNAVSGYIGSIVIWSSTASSGTVSVAEQSGGTVLRTFATETVTAATPVVFRPRFVGSTTAGVDLAAVTGSGSTNVTTALSVPYEKPLVKGNVVLTVVPGNALAATWYALITADNSF